MRVDRERMALEVRRAGAPALALLALIALSIGCALVIFANNGVTLPWDSTYQRQIALDNAKGIVAKEQTVRLAGVTVGRIEAIGLQARAPGGHDLDRPQVRAPLQQRADPASPRDPAG